MVLIEILAFFKTAVWEMLRDFIVTLRNITPKLITDPIYHSRLDKKPLKLIDLLLGSFIALFFRKHLRF